jgi:hypothetical protein
MRSLPVNAQGYPVPYFARDPERLSRVDPGKRWWAVARRRCWSCGKRLVSSATFVLGPAQALSRETTEPPAHRACAGFTIRTCPFLTNPRYQRSGASAHAQAAQNPGCFALWTTREYRFDDDADEPHLRLMVGDPLDVAWFCQGRRATRAEVLQAFKIDRPLGLKLDARTLEWLPRSGAKP